ncbi:hypothetical protein QL285_073588 [Trifolium repens]|nr:hypothetical protein QL285_093508 [Trifolium repens]KAK2372459.1 hypothetical protein QL285_073588 [Trifolium repens]
MKNEIFPNSHRSSSLRKPNHTKLILHSSSNSQIPSHHHSFQTQSHIQTKQIKKHHHFIFSFINSEFDDEDEGRRVQRTGEKTRRRKASPVPTTTCPNSSPPFSLFLGEF